MITLVGGPAEGTYMVKRAPYYLRAVVNSEGKKDVLDQLDDKPDSNEKIYIYSRRGESAMIHLNFGGGKGGYYAVAEYEYIEDIDGESLRDNEAWRDWCAANFDVKVDRETGIIEGGQS